MLCHVNADIAYSSDPSKDSLTARVNQVFQKGKTYYESGDYDSAIKEWKKLDPYLEQYPSFKKVIGYLKSQILTGPGTTKAADTAVSPALNLTPIKPVLSEANENIQTALKTALKERSKIKADSTDRDAWIRSTLRRGQVAYENGNWTLALEEWRKIEPFLDPNSAEYNQFQNLKKNYELMISSQKQNEELKNNVKRGIKVPSEFMEILEAAQKRLESEVLEVRNRQESIEKDAVFQQAWVDSTFEKGKQAYEAGNYDLAVEEWDKLALKLKNQLPVTMELEKLKNARRDFRQAEIGYAKSADASQVLPPGLEQMRTFWQLAAENFKSKASKLSKEGTERQLSMQDQQKRVDEVFEKGKVFYTQGKYKDALQEWMLLSTYFDQDPVTKSAFLSAQGAMHSYDMALKTYQSDVNTGAYKLRLPDGFLRYVENANQEIAGKTRSAEDERKKTELAISSKRAEVVTAFEQGKSYYAQGNILEAIAQWRKIVPWVENGENFSTQLQQIEANYKGAARENMALKEARSKSVSSLMPPAELSQLLISANEDLKNRAQTALNERLTLDQTVSDKQSKVSALIYKASLAYKSGKVDQAIAEWDKLLPYLDPASEERALIEVLKQTYSEYSDTTRTYKDAIVRNSSKVKIPDDLKGTLAATNETLLQKAASYRGELSVLDKDYQARQAVLLSSMERGKAFYQTGRFTEAAAEWDKIINYFDPASLDRQLLENFRQNVLDKAESEKQLQLARNKKGLKLELPEDSRKSIADSIHSMIQKNKQLQNERDTVEASLHSRDSVVVSALEKGKIFYEAGRMDQAILEWEKLLPYLDETSKDRTMVENLKIAYADYQDAQAKNQILNSKKDVKAKIPEEIAQDVAKKTEELVRKTSQLRVDTQTQQSELTGRQTTILSSIEKGKIFFQTQRLDQAISEWEKLLPFMDPTSQDKLMIENLKNNFSEFSKASNELSQLINKKDQKVQIPEDLAKTLSLTNQQLIEKTNRIRSEQESIELNYRDRQTSAMTALEKAKVYTQAGRMDQALPEWKKIIDNLDDKTNVRLILQELELNYQQYLKTKQDLDEKTKLKSAKFETPQGLTDLISDANRKILTLTQNLEKDRSNLAQETAQKQSFVEAKFTAGRNLADQGKLYEAVQEWKNILPYLGDQPGVRALIETFDRQWGLLQDTKKSNEDYVANEYNKLKMPFTSDMQKILIDFDGKLRASVNDIESQRAKMEKSIIEKEAWLNSTFEKGKAYYEVEKYPEAIEYWTQLLPHMKDQANIQVMMAGLPLRYQNLQEAQKKLVSLENKSREPMPAPAGLAGILQELTSKLEADNMDVMSRQEKAVQSSQARKKQMEEIYSQGKSYYDAGKWEDAIKTWAALPDFMQDGPKVKVMIDNLMASYRNFTMTQKGAQEAESKLNAKFPSPENLSILLADAVFKLDKETQVANLSRDRTEKIITEKQAAIKKIYDDGKVFYDQGKLSDALAAWRSIVPSLSDEREITEALAKADQSYQMYLAAKDQNQQVTAKKEARLASPAELLQILEDANQKYRDEIFDLKSRAAQTEKLLQDRKSWVEVTFQKGKLAFSQGRYQDAVTEWKTLLPFLDNGSQLEKLIIDFERNLKVSMESSDIFNQAEQKKTAKFAAPDELGVLLMEINEKVKNDAMEANAQKIRAEQQYSEKQKWIQQAFETGKSFYMQNKYDDALAEWIKLGPYFDEQSGVQKLLDAVKQSFNDATIAKKKAVEAAAGQYPGLQLPYGQQMIKFLSEADAKLKKEAQEYQDKKGELEKTMAERQEWSVTTFNRGKVYYDQGQYEEALGQWERLLPYLEDGGVIKNKIQTLRENHNIITAGKNFIGDDQTASKRPIKLRNEDEVLSVLKDAEQKFRGEAEVTRIKQLEIEKSIEQRQKWVEHTFDKGKEYYDLGNYAKAVEEWSVLTPYLSDYPQVREMIEAAKKRHSEGYTAKKIIETMEAKKAALVPLPPAAAPVSSRVPAQEEVSSIPEAAENLQLVSGEIVSVAEPEKTMTLKLFTESGANETLTINYDERTQVDGAGSKTISSVQNGSSIDVRYNPQTSRAFYIYVY